MTEECEHIDFSKMKKKRKPKLIAGTTDSIQLQNEIKYNEMLDQIFSNLKTHRGGNLKTNSQKIIIKGPEIQKIGTKKTAIVNFLEICDTLRRPSDHVSEFFFQEFGNEGSISQNILIIKGRYTESQIEVILKKYITEYVLCQMCRSMQTNLVRDPSIRTFMLKCEKCECIRSVQPLHKFYHHSLKADRKKAKMAEH
ncbi:unnamed protein product [Blepharisma stoltei]|uniref:Translation initiation factor IF2/IF5 domain-containing protein n=1 Tax=Blepharisma stoltei TaxID=1481888 RepID=A0AAU9K1F8_9CILI|nr:unnamed protein product [Blepharisma stoltei]